MADVTTKEQCFVLSLLGYGFYREQEQAEAFFESLKNPDQLEEIYKRHGFNEPFKPITDLRSVIINIFLRGSILTLIFLLLKGSLHVRGVILFSKMQILNCDMNLG